MQRSSRSKGVPVWISGLLSLVLVVTGSTFDASLSYGSATYSPLVYPSPIPAKTSTAMSQCPNPKGLEVFTPIAISQAAHEASQVAAGKLPVTRLMTDPSFWSSLTAFRLHLARNKTPQFPHQEVIKGVPSGPGDAIVSKSCGKGLVAKTEVMEVIPLNAAGVQTCNDCVTNYYFIDRLGHTLFYGVF
jgi:hypothetical protein